MAEATMGIINDILGFIKSFIDAVKVIFGSIVKTPNYENPSYYPPNFPMTTKEAE